MEREIRDWFARHDGDDGDFFVTTSAHPFAVIPPKPDTDTVVYCTKQHCILGLIHKLGGPPRFAAVLRGGLPSDDDANWLVSQVGSRRLLFLGDADPSDLLAFYWLRERLPIQYAGLSDQLLLQCGVELRDNLTIQLAESEVAALPLVHQCLGDVPSQLGQWCSDLLASGRKIELEALFSFATCTPSELEAALLKDTRGRP
jgi:hypothetical protein